VKVSCLGAITVQQNKEGNFPKDLLQCIKSEIALGGDLPWALSPVLASISSED
jgi:hypothetical protein